MPWTTIREAISAWLLTLSAPEWLMLTAAVGALLLGFQLARRSREGRRARAALDEAIRLELHVPASLHPVIDPDVCIGSGSCISACPEGRILGLVDGVATLVNASHCIGHGRCAAECPVGAIRLVFGSAERGVDLPEVDTFFETSRPGVHVIGELGGMGLIKNALVQGLQVAARLREALPRPSSVSGLADLVIVGAGPAGIAAAVGARAAGLSFELVEQDTVGGAVAHYPRQKVVMTEPVQLPFYGTFGRAQMSKEDLVAAFSDVTAAARIEVHERAKVTAIGGQRDDFSVTTSRGILRARRVVLAIGRRGTPRLLGVPGQDLAKVTSRLVDPGQYQGKRVLVVGGGDSALEAAIMLAEQSTAEVGIAYRRPEFGRCRPLNKQKIDALVAQGRVRALMSTEVAAVEPAAVVVETGPGRQEALPNDFVIACLGGELPTEFLRSIGVGIHRHRGDRAMANPSLGRTVPNVGEERIGALTLATLGAGILFLLAAVGNGYYLMPQAERYRALDHGFLKPSGVWGHGVGVLATAVMLLNFVYSIRKRARWLKRKGSIGPWLRFHVFVGLMSPAVILFHSAFEWQNQLATATYVSLVVVVVTGLVGRFIYGFHRLDADDPKQLSEIRDSLGPLLETLSARGGSIPRRVSALGDGSLRFPTSLAGLLLAMPADGWLLRWSLSRMRPAFLDGGSYRQFRWQTLLLRRLESKIRFHRGWKRLMRAWRALHVTLAIMLLGLIGAHVWISVRVGLKWPWS